jgi:hypothetical protein
MECVRRASTEACISHAYPLPGTMDYPALRKYFEIVFLTSRYFFGTAFKRAFRRDL